MSQPVSSPPPASPVTQAPSSNPFRAPASGARLAHLSSLIPPAEQGKPLRAEACAPAVTYSIYAAGAPHLADFAQRIGVTIFKIGLSRFGVQNRIASLSRHRYAGCWGQTGQPATTMTALEQADNWFQVKMERPTDFSEELNPDLRFQARAIQFDLAGSIHPEIVDQALHHLLANRSLNAFLRTDSGQIRLGNAGIDQNSWFHTWYRNEDKPDQLVPARELYLFDPRQDMTVFTTGLSQLVAHLQQGEH